MTGVAGTQGTWGRGVCRRKDGTVKAHYDRETGRWCAGVGHPPKEIE